MKTIKKRNQYLIISGIIIIIIIMLLIFGQNKQQNSSQMSTTAYERKISEFDKVREWYSNNKTQIGNSFLDLMKANGVSGSVQYSIQLKFDGDLGVYYIVNYSGGIRNGNYVSGHARAFVKYLNNDIQWFSLEIAYDSNPYSPIVDWYKDEYDDICEKYYYELRNKYN